MTESKLLPCPFCGATGAIRKVPSNLAAFYCYCEHGCGICGPTESSEQEAADIWNTRPAPAPVPTLDDEIKELGLVRIGDGALHAASNPDTSQPVVTRGAGIDNALQLLEENIRLNTTSDWQTGPYGIVKAYLLYLEDNQPKVTPSCGCVFKDIGTPCQDENCKVCKPVPTCGAIDAALEIARLAYTDQRPDPLFQCKAAAIIQQAMDGTKSQVYKECGQDFTDLAMRHAKELREATVRPDTEALREALQQAVQNFHRICEWRKSAHHHDDDMGHPLRDFGDEDWEQLENFAVRAGYDAEQKLLALAPVAKQNKKEIA